MHGFGIALVEYLVDEMRGEDVVFVPGGSDNL